MKLQTKESIKASIILTILFGVLGCSSYMCERHNKKVAACTEPDELIYKEAILMDIKRDDESEYHIMFRLNETGEVISIYDKRNVKIWMGDYEPRILLPYGKYKHCEDSGSVAVYDYRIQGKNPTKFYNETVKIYLPTDHEIGFFDD
ncbi:MAG: hypothetical protein ACI9J3_003301 [Parvicellaceae bacterium]|jgi:hypothetical protein